jgi:hypothetical protein
MKFRATTAAAQTKTKQTQKQDKHIVQNNKLYTIT